MILNSWHIKPLDYIGFTLLAFLFRSIDSFETEALVRIFAIVKYRTYIILYTGMDFVSFYPSRLLYRFHFIGKRHILIIGRLKYTCAQLHRSERTWVHNFLNYEILPIFFISSLQWAEAESRQKLVQLKCEKQNNNKINFVFLSQNIGIKFRTLNFGSCKRTPVFIQLLFGTHSRCSIWWHLFYLFYFFNFAIIRKNGVL